MLLPSHNKFSIFLLACIILPSFAISQSISGQIVDEKGEGVPFASVYIKELTLGIASSDEGKFKIKVSPGNYNLVFQSLGYGQEIRTVNVGANGVNLTVLLKERHYNLEAVTFSLKSEDPAYPIMRKAIGLAPYHAKQVKSYSAEVYIKGKVNVLKLSRLVKRMLRKEEDAPKEGELYVHESNNELKFKLPNSYEQKVLSVRNTFPGVDSNDPMQFVSLNLYQPTFEWLMLPLAPNAFTHYRFKYLGYFEDAGKLIYKIQVTPRRKNQQFLSGVLYIVDNLYCIHSADLQGEFIAGKFSFKTQLAELNPNLWMPVSHIIDFEVKMLGNNAEVNYLASVKYNSVDSNDRLISSIIKLDEPSTQTEGNGVLISSKEVKKQQKVDELLRKENLSNREMRKLASLIKDEPKVDTVKSLEIVNTVRVKVDSMAKNRDSSYWASLRPIPLSNDELKSFQAKDSLIRLAGPDSLRKRTEPSYRKRRSMAKVALNGGMYSPKKAKWSFHSQGLSLKSIDFNTVDGFVPTYSFGLARTFNKKWRLSLNQSYSYAWARNELMYTFNLSMPYKPESRGHASVGVGSGSKDFNQTSGINRMINSFVTLTFRENYLKLFHEQWAFATNSIDLANGLVLSTSARIYKRDTLENSSDFSVFYNDVKHFAPNHPFNSLFNESQKDVALGAGLNVRLTYTPEYYYRMFGKAKYMVRSKYPTFSISYNLNRYFSEQTSFSHHLQLRVFQKKKLEMNRELYYSVAMGAFLNSTKLHFADFKHFDTQPLYLNTNDLPTTFVILPFYSRSTNSHWVELHSSYKTDFLALKFLPILSELNAKEAVFISGLSTKQTPYYLEFGYGFTEIFETYRISGHVGIMQNGVITYGFRIGVTNRVFDFQ